MLKLFNSNNDEIGSLNKNLILNTQGKVKIRYGKKFIDLLDNNGNINVKIPKTILEKKSTEDINSDGIYIVDNELYAYCNKNLIKLTGLISDENGDNVLVGLKFIPSDEELSINDFPRYSEELNNLLLNNYQNIQNNELIIPTIGWITEKLNIILLNIDSINEKIDN